MERRAWLGVVACAALVACGGGEKNASAQAEAAAPPQTAVAAPAAAAGEQGPAVYQRVCATCHQRNGMGLPGAFPPLGGSEIATGPADRMIKIVLHGLQGPITVKGQRYNNVMPPWKSLSDAEIASVLTYVRSSFGNTAGAVTVDEVAAVRAATASRTTMMTAAELE